MGLDFASLVLAPCQKVFGEAITYIPLRAAQYATQGIFDKAYTDIEWRDGVAITQTMPVLGINLSDYITAPAQGDHLVARGLVYAVREVRLDGHGGAKLMLNYDDDFVYPP